MPTNGLKIDDIQANSCIKKMKENCEKMNEQLTTQNGKFSGIEHTSRDIFLSTNFNTEEKMKQLHQSLDKIITSMVELEHIQIQFLEEIIRAYKEKDSKHGLAIQKGVVKK